MSSLGHECTIGIWHDYEDSDAVTDAQVKQLVEHENRIVRSQYRTPLKDYYDRRRVTELEHFDYCPYCGRKIDWAKLRKEAKD